MNSEPIASHHSSIERHPNSLRTLDVSEPMQVDNDNVQLGMIKIYGIEGNFLNDQCSALTITGWSFARNEKFVVEIDKTLVEPDQSSSEGRYWVKCGGWYYILDISMRKRPIQNIGIHFNHYDYRIPLLIFTLFYGSVTCP